MRKRISAVVAFVAACTVASFAQSALAAGHFVQWKTTSSPVYTFDVNLKTKDNTDTDSFLGAVNFANEITTNKGALTGLVQWTDPNIRDGVDPTMAVPAGEEPANRAWSPKTFYGVIDSVNYSPSNGRGSPSDTEATSKRQACHASMDACKKGNFVPNTDVWNCYDGNDTSEDLYYGSCSWYCANIIPSDSCQNDGAIGGDCQLKCLTAMNCGNPGQYNPCGL